MKKATMKSLVSYLNDMIAQNGGEEHTSEELVTARDEMVAELSRGEMKANANREMYASAHDVIMDALRSATAPVTISELYEAIKTELPSGFSKSKVQYAITRLYADEVVKTEGKVNTYSIKE